MAEATLEAKISVKDAASTDVFEKGVYGAAHITVKASNDEKVKASLPVDVFIVTPTTEGNYPVLLFCHGWNMANQWYTTMFDHIASHGYIVVAPQFYFFPLPLFWGISISEEIGRANGVVEWLSTGLLTALEKSNYKNIYPDVENNLVVSGHSRGGKVAFALAIGETGDTIHHKNETAPCTVRDSPPHKFKAVVGIDPVEGSSTSNRPLPKILSYIPRSLSISVPVAVIGSGLGNQNKWQLQPCAAADGVNHAEFFNESKPPSCYFVAKEFGHLDMMDDNICLDAMRSLLATNGEAGSRALMRKAVGGAVVAFLRTYLGGREDDLDVIVNDPSVAPIVLEPVLHFKE